MADYRLDPVAFRAEILNAPWMVAEMKSRAEGVRAAAEATAPRQTGNYSRSFSVDARAGGGIHGDRAEATVSSDDPAALSIEFGNSRQSGHYTLTRAMDAAR